MVLFFFHRKRINLPGPVNGLTRGFITVRASFNDVLTTVSAKLHGSRMSTLASLALA